VSICPRASAEVIEELRALLPAAEVPAPYLLVGHSLGGLYAITTRSSIQAMFPAWCCSTRHTRRLQRLHAQGPGRPMAFLGRR
jgi:hypothetical protein